MNAPQRPRVILHLDMDAFFASVEQRDNPRLLGKPVVVGSSPEHRGVVAAASYEARKFGIRSAMPSRTAGRLCPHAVFVRPRIDRYREESHRIFAIVESMGGLLEQVSIDEGYLDVSAKMASSDVESALLDALPLARAMKEAIRSQCGLTATVGIATNKMLAKIASDYRKPDGLTLIPERDKVPFLRPLPVSTIHGVGQVTAEHLRKAGLHTIGDLQDHPGDLRSVVGSWGPTLKQRAMGEDDRPLDLSTEIKSISSENTFDRDTDNRPILRQCLREQASEIAAKLQRRRMVAHTVQVKVRYGDFTTLTRQISLEEAVATERELYRLGAWLLGRERLVHRPLRLLGLGVSGLVESAPVQLQLKF